MRRPRLRFTVRRLMIAVGVVAIALGSILWVARMRIRSASHLQRAQEFEWSLMRNGSTVTMPDGRRVDWSEDENDRISDAWTRRLAEKYRRLSCYPWLAVQPDPPRPVPLAHPRSALEFPEDIELPLEDDLPWYQPRPRPPVWTFLWTWTWPWRE